MSLPVTDKENSVTRSQALELMQHHLDERERWHKKAKARERENLQLLARHEDQFPSTNVPEYDLWRINKDDFWLKYIGENRRDHENLAIMYATVAEALRD
jgi:hypothetical protein